MSSAAQDNSPTIYGGDPLDRTVVGTDTGAEAYRCGGQTAGSTMWSDWTTTDVNVPVTNTDADAGQTVITKVKFGTSGLKVTVDTSSCAFQSDHPNYVASVDGDYAHWQLIGTNSIYAPAKDSFELYLWHPTSRQGVQPFQTQVRRRRWRVPSVHAE